MVDRGNLGKDQGKESERKLDQRLGSTINCHSSPLLPARSQKFAELSLLPPWILQLARASESMRITRRGGGNDQQTTDEDGAADSTRVNAVFSALCSNENTIVGCCSEAAELLRWNLETETRLLVFDRLKDTV